MVKTFRNLRDIQALRDLCSLALPRTLATV